MHDPFHQLHNDWDAAKQANDPLAALCGLATVDSADRRPRIRTLILWDIRAEGLILLTNNTSPKWRELQQDPHFEAVILWTAIQMQYRLRGRVRSLSGAELSAVWPKKRYELKLLDHYYSRFQPQSTPVSREEFLTVMSALESEFPDRDAVPMPDTAKGLMLSPAEIDVWDGRSRFPERRLFVRMGETWTQQDLVP